MHDDERARLLLQTVYAYAFRLAPDVPEGFVRNLVTAPVSEADFETRVRTALTTLDAEQSRLNPDFDKDAAVDAIRLRWTAQ